MAIEAETRALLKRVSRSMYLSLAVLPKPVRDAMGLGYLFCRAADTIADTRLVPIAQRRQTLDRFQEAFASGEKVSAHIAEGFAEHQASRAERELLERLGDCVGLFKRFPEPERRLLQKVVAGVCDGMRMDLELFSGDTLETLAALQSPAQLEKYCAYIGGEPGLFWTDLCLLRLPELKGADTPVLRELGRRLGEGLQITNILRDIPKDLRIGRCYLPEPELRDAGLAPRDLTRTESVSKLRPVLGRWLRWGLKRLESGAKYVKQVPGLRLRSAAAWPLLLSLKTLALIGRSNKLLRIESRVKVSRSHVYGLMAASPWFLSSDARFQKKYDAYRAELESTLTAS